MIRPRFAGFLLLLAALAVLCGACTEKRTEPRGNARGAEFLVCCCIADFPVAEDYSRRIMEAVPGSSARIAAVKVGDGSERLVFEIYASHPDMTPDQLAEKLVECNCPKAG